MQIMRVCKRCANEHYIFQQNTFLIYTVHPPCITHNTWLRARLTFQRLWDEKRLVQFRLNKASLYFFMLRNTIKDTLCIYLLQRGKQLWHFVIHSIHYPKQNISPFDASYTVPFHMSLTTTSKIWSNDRPYCWCLTCEYIAQRQHIFGTDYCTKIFIQQWILESSVTYIQ